jgi:hypothetical protein
LLLEILRSSFEISHARTSLLVTFVVAIVISAESVSMPLSLQAVDSRNMTAQQLIHPPVNTSTPVLDTVSVLSQQYAFLFQVVPDQYTEPVLEDPPPSPRDYTMAPTAVKKAVELVKNNTHYLFPAIILNPILFLHALNAILTASLPDLNIPYTTRTWFQPHLDINNSNTVATIYTFFIIVVQGFACQYCIDVSKQQELQREAEGLTTGDDYWQGD